MRGWLAVVMMSVCGVVSAISSEVMWAGAQVERELLAVRASLQVRPQGTPTPFGMPSAILSVGMDARVQMLDDEWLNLRSEPTRSSEVLAMLKDGARLVLLEGPIEAEGYLWWKVLVGGREGWLVEQAGDTQAVITIRETATPGA
jgi:uncharacterized protein YgiM (DUF1202 family)